MFIHSSPRASNTVCCSLLNFHLEHPVPFLFASCSIVLHQQTVTVLYIYMSLSQYFRYFWYKYHINRKLFSKTVTNQQAGKHSTEQQEQKSDKTLLQIIRRHVATYGDFFLLIFFCLLQPHPDCQTEVSICQTPVLTKTNPSLSGKNQENPVVISRMQNCPEIRRKGDPS